MGIKGNWEDTGTGFDKSQLIEFDLYDDEDMDLVSELNKPVYMRLLDTFDMFVENQLVERE